MLAWDPGSRLELTRIHQLHSPLLCPALTIRIGNLLVASRTLAMLVVVVLSSAYPMPMAGIRPYSYMLESQLTPPGVTLPSAWSCVEDRCETRCLKSLVNSKVRSGERFHRRNPLEASAKAGVRRRQHTTSRPSSHVVHLSTAIRAR